MGQQKCLCWLVSSKLRTQRCRETIAALPGYINIHVYKYIYILSQILYIYIYMYKGYTYDRVIYIPAAQCLCATSPEYGCIISLNLWRMSLDGWWQWISKWYKRIHQPKLKSEVESGRATRVLILDAFAYLFESLLQQFAVIFQLGQVSAHRRSSSSSSGRIGDNRRSCRASCHRCCWLRHVAGHAAEYKIVCRSSHPLPRSEQKLKCLKWKFQSGNVWK